MTLEEIQAALAGLTRAELRQVGWDSLMLSDGPEHVEGDPGAVHTVRVKPLPTLAFTIFVNP